jgi:DNA polymerase-3 subunit epsilon
MKLKLKKPIVFFDLETTGTDVNSDRIVEFAGIKFNVDGTQEQMVQRYNPRMPIPKEASDIHGITNHDVEPCPYFTDVAGAPEIAKFMRGCDLAGYNITKFDVPLLYNEMQRCGGYLLDITCNIIDCCDIFHKREARDLTAAVKFYTGEKFENAHSALDDIEATIKVMDGQLAMY